MRSSITYTIELGIFGLILGVSAADFQLPVREADPRQLLALQRSSTLIAGSQNQKRNTVRVVNYGQSISLQRWANELLESLPKQFPNTEFILNNKAISSFNANYLIQTAEADVYPLLPDLILFHCYGPYLPGENWEAILTNFRKRTTADIILIGNHPTSQWHLWEPTNSTKIDFPLNPITHAESWINYVRIPHLSAELGLCNPDTRTGWKSYLVDHGLKTQDFLVDGLHLNRAGSDLLRSLLSPYLKAKSLAPQIDPYNNSRVQTHFVGSEKLLWTNGRLRLPFTGNRVDLISGKLSTGSCRVLIDGRPPSEWPSGTGHSRTSSWALDPASRPAILNVAHQGPLTAQLWQLTITDQDSMDPRKFAFRVEGSSTGFDGVGTSDERFVSNSRQVVIETNAWYFNSKSANLPNNFRITWMAEVRCVDEWRPGVMRGNGLETSINLVNDLPDGEHVVELTATDLESIPSVTGLRVFHPGGAMPGTELPSSGTPALIRYLRDGESLLLVWPIKEHDAIPMTSSTVVGSWSQDPGSHVDFLGFRTIAVSMENPSSYFRLRVSQ